MAKNIFVCGGYKRLREEMLQYKKGELALAQKLFAYTEEEKQFKMRDWTVFPRPTFLQQQYYLLKQCTMPEVEKTRLDQIKLSLQNKQSEPEKQCQEHETVRKIETRAKMNHAKEQVNALKKRVARSTGNNLETEKDWELMSELDKDEFICQKIIREL